MVAFHECPSRPFSGPGRLNFKEIKMKNEDLVKRIIKFSESNTAGLTLSKEAIEAVLEVCDKKSSIDQIDKLLQEYQDEGLLVKASDGYLVKASDFMEALKPVKKEPKLHRKAFNRYLEYKFTKAEITEIALSLAIKTGERQTAEDQKKSANSQFKSQIDGLTADINLLSNHVVAGFEMRNVKCEAEFWYDDNIKRIARIDTGEIIWAGAIPEHEKQVEMSFEENLDKELGLEDKAHEELLNTGGEAQSPATEPNATDGDKSAGDGIDLVDIIHDAEKELSQENDKNEEETQADLDAEDDKIKEDIQTDLPPLPNEK